MLFNITAKIRYAVIMNNKYHSTTSLNTITNILPVQGPPRETNTKKYLILQCHTLALSLNEFGFYSTSIITHR